MSAWTRFRDRITARLLNWLGLDDINDAFGGVPASTPPEPPADVAGGEPSHPATNEEPVSSSDGSSGAATSVAGSFSWRFGGFDGSKAAEDSRCRVSRLSVKAAGLSLHWDTGIPADWKRSGEGFVVAALFYWDGARWIGGKFDWIDTARSTRDFKNIDAGYNGWNAAAFRAAKKHAFCVVSADGRKRSPFVED